MLTRYAHIREQLKDGKDVKLLSHNIAAFLIHLNLKVNCESIGDNYYLIKAMQDEKAH